MSETPVIFKNPYKSVIETMKMGVFDLLHTGVAFINAKGVFEYCNAAFLRMYALPRDVIGRNAREFFMVDTENLADHMQSQKMTITLGQSANHIFGVLFSYPVYNQFMEFCGVAIESIPNNLDAEKLGTLLESMRSLEMKTFSPRVRKKRGHKPPHTFSTLIGRSPVMENLRYLGERFARSDEPILISGESGTGKELVARSLHNASPRANRPFVTVNCAALPPELIEAELFGFESGSFTGARDGGMKGKFEQSDGGVIFLDEVGELPLAMQAKLLRALESGEVQKIGHSGSLHCNFRLVGATNRDLEQMVREGSFREDLFHRLNVFELRVPPLRERGDDVFLLTRFYLEQYLDDASKVWLDEELEELFKTYAWPGNIRELKNTLVYALYTLEKDCVSIRAGNLPKRFLNRAQARQYPVEVEERTQKPLSRAHDPNPKSEEYRLLRETLENMRYNKAMTARKLGVSRSKLYRMLDKYGLND